MADAAGKRSAAWWASAAIMAIGGAFPQLPPVTAGIVVGKRTVGPYRQSWELELYDGDLRGWVAVDQATFEALELGDRYE